MVLQTHCSAYTFSDFKKCFRGQVKMILSQNKWEKQDIELFSFQCDFECTMNLNNLELYLGMVRVHLYHSQAELKKSEWHIKEEFVFQNCI